MTEVAADVPVMLLMMPRWVVPVSGLVPPPTCRRAVAPIAPTPNWPPTRALLVTVRAVPEAEKVSAPEKVWASARVARVSAPVMLGIVNV